MDLYKTLQKLTAAPSVSGCEDTVANVAMELIEPICHSVTYTDGNVIATCGNTAKDAPHILLDAHMDGVGFYVTAITDDGFVHVGAVGGLDARFMPDERVLLHGEKTISGVISCLPPHLQKGATIQPIDEIAIDTGYDATALRKIIHLGDSVTFDDPLQRLANDTVCGATLDDRCSMVAIMAALEEIKDETIPYRVSVLFSTQEEVGERGATIGAYRLDPDYAIALDVTFARMHGDDDTPYGILGSGPMIGIAPSLSRGLSNAVIEAAKRAKTPYQIEVMASRTGTNADQITLTRNGVATGTLSIPLRYMHTPAEVISLRDITYTGHIVAELLRLEALSC